VSGRQSANLRVLASAAAVAAALLAGGQTAQAQGNVTTERGAAALGSVLNGLGTTGRVLTIAAHPDDEDTQFIAWLTRGRHVETAYLSLTRGDGGQNLIGNELGEALGAIRTQELLSARRIDGGRQYFSRAYDFGFSKNAEETYGHWPKDTILGDVIRVVRAFRPHVMVGFFSGTPRDGHGHHQVSGLLAREAYDLAADTVRFPVAGFGAPWTPSKFYRSSRQNPAEATLRMNVGEYDALLGRSYYEIAAESRSQHKSQGFGVLQRKGVIMDAIRREASRVGPENAADERSLFDGVDTTWARLGVLAGRPVVAMPLDSAGQAMAEARRVWRAQDPQAVIAPLAQALRLLRVAQRRVPPPPALPSSGGRRVVELPAVSVRADGSAPAVDPRQVSRDSEVADALVLTIARVERALLLASGVAVEATAAQAVFPVREPAKRGVRDSLPVTITVFNRGRAPVQLFSARAWRGERTADTVVTLAADSAVSVQRFAVARTPTSPWWRERGRKGRDWFEMALDGSDETQREELSAVMASVDVQIAGERIALSVPVVHRYADPIKGDQQQPVHAVPGITIGLASAVEYIRAGVPVERDLPVLIQSAYDTTARVTVTLELPKGLVADSAERVRVLSPGMGTTVVFRVRGMIPPGRHQLGALAFHEGTASTAGYYTINYDHINPQRLYGASGMYLSAVSVKLPPRARVGYIQGSGDLGLDALKQLDVVVENIPPSAIAGTDLSRFTSIVVGPRAYEASDELVRQNPRLLEYARRGGTLVVQYGAQDMSRFPVTPYPLQWTRPAARVTMEDAPVTVLQPTSPLLTTPNRIGPDDWAGWVQERATYMPSTIDPRYTPLLAMNDPNEPENRGALLVAPVGKGRYVYVTLALFRQLPNGVPGAARMLLNLINAAPIPVPPKM
jgi:LmbE family N-acetylglucosaminyl deacetylase